MVALAFGTRDARLELIFPTCDPLDLLSDVLQTALWNPALGLVSYFLLSTITAVSYCLFVLRFYGPVNPMGSCQARSVYLTTHLLGRLVL